MRFDDFWPEDDKDATQALTEDRPLPADGRHSGTIKVSEIRDVPFKVSDANKNGTSLVVKVAIKGCRLVEDIVPVQYRGAIQAICRAARVAPPSRGADWNPADLMDAEVQVETTLHVSQKGTEYVRVKWVDGPAGVRPTRVERAVAQPAKSGRPQLGDDDIPF